MDKGKCLVAVLVLAGLLWSAVGLAAGLDMEFKQAPLADVYQILGEIAGYNVLIDPTVEGTVSFYLKNLSVDDALDLISRTTGYGYEIVNNTLIVASAQRLQMEFTNKEFLFIGLNNVTVLAAEKLMAVVLPSLKAYTDPDHNLIVLYGTKEQVLYGKSLLEQYDEISLKSKPEPAKTIPAEVDLTLPNLPQAEPDVYTPKVQFFWQVVSFGDGEAILRSIQRLFPQREFGWDAYLQLISGTVTPEEWDHISALITQQDVPDFVIKGIITSGEKVLVLVDYNATTTLVEEGSSLAGWVLTEVVDKNVLFSRDGQNFGVTMGR